MSTTKREELREKLLARGKGRQYTTVTMPDGEEYGIRDLSPREAMQQKMVCLSEKGDIDMSRMVEANMRMVALCLVDPETKEQLLDPKEWELFDDWRDADFEKLHDACLEHCGMNEDAQINGQVKNSDGAGD